MFRTISTVLLWFWIINRYIKTFVESRWLGRQNNEIYVFGIVSEYFRIPLDL